jgi:hypothetical protein
MNESDYAAPALTEIGTLHDLTLQNTKDLTGSDGEVFQNQGLGPVS